MSSAPVSILVPSLDDREQLGTCLPLLLAEVQRRGAGSEIIVIDDTGSGSLSRWIERRFHGVRTIARESNGGFARALLDGVQSAAHELVFSMNPDIRPAPGFLDPLVEALEDTGVAAAVPKLLLGGDPRLIESITALGFERGLVALEQPGLEGGASGEEPCTGSDTLEVAFAVGGAMLLRRQEFLDGGGFDALYEPFYYEDVDLGLSAWAAGRRVVYCPDAVLEHHHRGTIGAKVAPELVRAVIERNRLLLQLKFAADHELAEQVTLLRRRALDAFLRDEREELVWVAFALDRSEELLRSRARRAERGEALGDLFRRARPAS